MSYLHDQIFKGKVAVITGANRGIGKAIALEFARKGCDIVAVARNVPKLQELEEEVKKIGVRIHVASIDVRDKEKVDDLMNNFVPKFGGIDMLVNNAAITIRKDVMETTMEDVDEIFNINLKGYLSFAQDAAKLMIKQKRGGSIVFVTSVNAVAPLPPQAMYSSSKAAIEAMMRCFAITLAPYGIRVNTVAPGAIDTEMNSFTPEGLIACSKIIPLNKVGISEEMAHVVGFVSSDEASYMTGSTVLADGGLMLRKG
jgi:NAD(P)-dependent dehydrogenase (short-subunit alcohol dehydrogenase family)